MQREISASQEHEPQAMDEAEFFTLCGLDRGSGNGQQTYQLMREEAVAGIDRMTLTARSTPGVTGPQINGHIILASMLSESAIRHEIHRIWQFAHPETKAVYERGGAGNEENWIIRWLLWQEIVRRDGSSG
ncbi:hypothetical protein AC579_9822 [Pseudocercospora musae]|uniref:Uncharacterized protein n=1 Tax=Pseudocercospora musae TaxID=113226 RepID=A0A139IVH0_9PEZI|nr:hypothetical protein AC579_9822 [Pseudocercospora musae]